MMEDDNWIELRLGLPYSGPSSKSEVNDVSSDPKAEEGNRNRSMNGNMNVSDVSFKHFFQTDLENEHCNGQNRNIWSDLRKGPSGAKKSSLVPFTTQDASWGENEVVTDFKAKESASWLISQREDNARCSDISKFTDKRVLPDQSKFGPEGQKRPCVSGNDSDIQLGKLAHGIVLQSRSLANGQCSRVHIANASNLQHSFGNSSVRLPILDADSSMVFGFQHQHIPSSTNMDQARVRNSDHCKEDVKISQEGKPVGSGQGRGKYADMATSTQPSRNEGDREGNNAGQKEASNQTLGEGSESSAIRPGVAPDMQFGGSGSYPDLPWVSTTGAGPNGRTISGVTYKYNKSQIRIVCACHGSHLSPEEFIQHASTDAPDPEDNTGSK